ncbi:MAG: serine/threonine-protein phosphatase, partial [Actinomycetota bacterium]|nr:serine/threonine-protein phosphatase [Actinomycetota bacterium]
DAEVAAEEAEVAAKSSAELAASLLESSERLAVLARTLQQSLLPPHLPRVPGVQVAAYFVPAASGEEVVGDFYDVFEGRRGAWCVLLGDVAGKGPEAATLTAMARYTLRAAAARSVQPRKILAALNAAMLHQRPDDDRFLTVAFATLRRIGERLVLSVCSAGHPPPLVRRADGEVELACPPGMPMGMFERPTLVEAKVELGPGDAVVFYSDGVTEARRGSDELGMERLRDLVRDAPATDAAGLVTYIETEVAAFTEGLPRDDTAVLVLRVPLL